MSERKSWLDEPMNLAAHFWLAALRHVPTSFRQRGVRPQPCHGKTLAGKQCARSLKTRAFGVPVQPQKLPPPEALRLRRKVSRGSLVDVPSKFLADVVVCQSAMSFGGAFVALHAANSSELQVSERGGFVVLAGVLGGVHFLSPVVCTA